MYFLVFAFLIVVTQLLSPKSKLPVPMVLRYPMMNDFMNLHNSKSEKQKQENVIVYYLYFVSNS